MYSNSAPSLVLVGGGEDRPPDPVGQDLLTCASCPSLIIYSSPSLHSPEYLSLDKKFYCHCSHTEPPINVSHAVFKSY